MFINKILENNQINMDNIQIDSIEVKFKHKKFYLYANSSKTTIFFQIIDE